MDKFDFKTIENDCQHHKMTIKLEKIHPFLNTCVVTGGSENVNVEVEYSPDHKLLEVVSYRKSFAQEFNESMEKLCSDVFDSLWNVLEPRWLKVTIYLDEARLTPWHVTIDSNEK